MNYRIGGINCFNGNEFWAGVNLDGVGAGVLPLKASKLWEDVRCFTGRLFGAVCTHENRPQDMQAACKQQVV